MAITPDPVGAFTATYKVASDANTEWQRVLIAQQQLAQSAVQQARQNKADDFNQMLKLVSLNQQGEENRLNNAYRRDALDLQRGGQGISRFNADTSRMEAQTQARRLEMTQRQSGDPLGLFPEGGDSAIPSATPGNYAAPASGTDFDLPDGNGGVRETTLEPFPADADAGQVPESIPSSDGGPTADLFPGSPAPADLSVPQAAPAAPAFAPDQPAVGGLTSGMDQQLPVPGDAAPAPTEQALPPEVLTVPSFSSVNLPQETRNTLFQLQQQQADLNQQAANARADAQVMRRSLPRVSEKYKPGYNQKLAEQEKLASVNEARAAVAKTKFDEGNRALPLLQKRQDAITQLNVLDDVLPPQDRQQLMAEAADPRTGGIADRKINTLNAYTKVREEYGLTHKSNGYATAEDVGRLGAQLSTPEAMAERKAAAQAETYRQLIKANNAKPPGEKKEGKVVDAWDSELAKHMAGELQWDERWTKFDKAVKADTFTETPPAAAAVVPAAAASSPPANVFAAADAARSQTATANPDNQQWTAAKSKLLDVLGGRQTIIDRLSKGDRITRPAAFKEFIRTQLRREREFDSASNTERLSEKEIGLDGLPKNASSFYDVADALAEDLMTEAGISPDGTPPISEAGRKKVKEFQVQ